MANEVSFKGIEIPVECGKGELLDHILILYQDMNKEQYGTKHNIYITREDFNDKKPFFTVVCNMNPTVVSYVNEEDPDGSRVVYEELYDEERILVDGFNELSFIIEDCITGYDWLFTTLEREEYLAIKPKKVLEYGGELYVER